MKTPLLLLTCLISSTALAQGFDTNAAHLRINRLEENLKVNADATYVRDFLVERQALSSEGAQHIGKFAQFVNKNLETLEILEAYTQKADGTKIPVGAKGLLVQQGVASSGTGASWPGVEIHQITFPDVQKGDKTIGHLRTTTHKPPLPGWMAFSDFVVPSLEYRKVSIHIEAPASMKLHVFSEKFTEVSKTNDQETDQWNFQLQQPEAQLMDSQPANVLVSYPRVLASTHADSGQLAVLFGQALLGKVVMDADLETLARTITENKASKEAKVAAVYDWVRKNIRYVAVYLGNGGWVPHDLSWILKNRYGDCKDHTLLMIALLKAIGVEGVPALINTGNDYVLPEAALGFNHVITYIPSMNVYADPTDARIPFGALPWGDADKPVAVAWDSGRLMRTPFYSAGSNGFHITTRLSIAKDGKASGGMTLTSHGMAATRVQDHLAQIPGGFAGTAVSRILENSQLHGRGFLVNAPVNRDAQEQSFKVNDLEIDNLIPDPTGGSINPHPQVRLPMYISSSMGDYTAAKRDYAVACEPITVREDFEMVFDPAYQLIRIPSNIKESHSDGIQFEAQYRREGNAVKGWRELALTQPRHVCSPEQYAARQPVMQRITQHLRSGVLFQQ